MLKQGRKKNRTAWILLAAIIGIIGLIVSFYFMRTRQGVISPFSAFWFDPPAYLFSIYGEGRNALSEPMAVSESADGRIFIADAGDKNIKVFDGEGTFKYKFSNLGNQGQMATPVGVTVNESTVYVTDSTKNQIFMFDLDGGFKGSLISPQIKAQLTAVTPVGIKIAQDYVFFTDILYHRVVQTDLSGNLVKTIGGPGNQPGRLAFPNDLAVSSDGKIYVSDSNNLRVQVCEDGAKFKLFSNSDALNQESVINTLVRGISVDEDNYIWIVNTLGNSVSVFDEDGHPVYIVGGVVSDESGMSYPNGISINNKRLYITDRGNKRVLVFSR